VFFVRQNKATSRSIVLNTLALAYIETPLISKQDKPKIGQEKRYKRDESRDGECQRFEIESQQ